MYYNREKFQGVEPMLRFEQLRQFWQPQGFSYPRAF
jgi:hypothetical protein